MEEEWTPLETDTEKSTRKIQLSIARVLHSLHGDGAYVVALTEMETCKPGLRDSWRAILNLLDEINNGE